MPKTRNIKEPELQKLAEEYPGKVGTYHPEKKELTTPSGDTLSLELGRIGRSDPVYVKGDIRDFLRGLNLPELAPAEKAVAGKTLRAKTISLSEVPSRQVRSGRSWKAWFVRHPETEPDVIIAAVREGREKAEEDIRQAREAEEKARREAEDIEILKKLRALKEKRSAAELAEMLDKA